jgi:hypothetical protein
MYASSNSPHFSGWAALALPVSQSAQAYSFTLYQAIPAGKSVTVSTTTGLGTILRTLPTKRGTLYLIGVATAGAATTSTATTGAFAGGGFAVFRFAHGLTIEIGGLQNKAGAAAKPNLLTGAGWTW